METKSLRALDEAIEKKQYEGREKEAARLAAATVEDLLDSSFELLGRTSGDERFLRRQEQPIRLTAFGGRGQHRGWKVTKR